MSDEEKFLSGIGKLIGRLERLYDTMAVPYSAQLKTIINGLVKNQPKGNVDFENIRIDSIQDAFKTAHYYSSRMRQYDEIADILKQDLTHGSSMSESYIKSLKSDIEKALKYIANITNGYAMILDNIYAYPPEANTSILVESYKKYPDDILALSYPTDHTTKNLIRRLVFDNCIMQKITPIDYFTGMLSTRLAKTKELNGEPAAESYTLVYEVGSAIYRPPRHTIKSVTMQSINNTQTIQRAKEQPPKIYTVVAGKRRQTSKINPANPIFYYNGTYHNAQVGSYFNQIYTIPNEFCKITDKVLGKAVVNTTAIKALDHYSTAQVKRDILNQLKPKSDIADIFRKTLLKAVKKYVADNSIPDFVLSETLTSYIGNLTRKQSMLNREITKYPELQFSEAAGKAIDNVLTDRDNIFTLLEAKKMLYTIII